MTRLSQRLLPQTAKTAEGRLNLQIPRVRGTQESFESVGC